MTVLRAGGLGGVHSTYLFLTVLDVGKSKIEVLADPVPGLQADAFLLCPHVIERKVISLQSVFIRALIPP